MRVENVTGTLKCPVCESEYTAYVRKVPTRRTKILLDLYSCLSCQSFWNPSSYDQSAVPPEKIVRWHEMVEQRNLNAARRLFDALAKGRVRPSRVLEIGCGAGAALVAARERRIEAVGFDVNPSATQHGREKYGLDLRCEVWSPALDIQFDLVLCISVLEHLEQPRSLLSDIALACRERSALAYISVPTVDQDRWPFLLNPDPHEKNTPFFDNDVHVTHFSSAGMIKALQSFGAVSVSRVSCGLWNGFLTRFQVENVPTRRRFNPRIPFW